MGFFDTFWDRAHVKKYALVKYASGKVGYRNYGRELKNGKGVSSMDRIADNITKNNALYRRLAETADSKSTEPRP